MQTIIAFEAEDWRFDTPLTEAQIDRILTVVHSDANGDARAMLATCTDPVQARAEAIALLDNREAMAAKVFEPFASRFDPYLRDHPPLPAAVLHEAYRHAGRLNAFETELRKHVESFADELEATLWREKIKRIAGERADLLRGQMQAAGVRYDAERFADTLLALRYEAPAPDDDDSADPETPDDELFPVPSPCGGDVSPERVTAVSQLAYVYPLEQFGLTASVRELARRWTAAEVDLDGDVKTLLFNQMQRSDNGLTDDVRRAVMDRVLGPQSGFPALAERLYQASVQYLRAQAGDFAGGALDEVATLAFDGVVEEIQCYASANGCGIVPLLAPEVIADAALALEMLSSDGVACALGLGACEASPYTAMTMLAPGLDRVSARATRDLALNGRGMVDAVKTLPVTDAERRQIAGFAVGYHRARFGATGSAQINQAALPPGTDEMAQTNGASQISLVGLRGR